MKKYNCICCGDEITQLEDIPGVKDWEGMWHNGIIEKVAAGYGSNVDGNMYVLAICDKCIAEKTDKGGLQFIGTY